VAVALKQMDDTPVKASVPRRVQITTIYSYPYVYNASNPQPSDERDVKTIELDAHGTAIVPLSVGGGHF